MRNLKLYDTLSATCIAQDKERGRDEYFSDSIKLCQWNRYRLHHMANWTLLLIWPLAIKIYTRGVRVHFAIRNVNRHRVPILHVAHLRDRLANYHGVKCFIQHPELPSAGLDELLLIETAYYGFRQQYIQQPTTHFSSIILYVCIVYIQSKYFPMVTLHQSWCTYMMI